MKELAKKKFYEFYIGMRVLFSNINPNFKQIQLSEAEKERGSRIADDIKSSVSETERFVLKTQLYDIYEPHLEKEIEEKTSSLGIGAGYFVNRLYLKFFEGIKTVNQKNFELNDFTEELNNFIETEEIKNNDLSELKLSDINENVKTMSEFFEISKEEYISLAQRNNYLITMSPEEIMQNVISTAKLLNMDVDEYKKNAITVPRLPTKFVDKIDKLLDDNSEILGISKEELIRMSKLALKILTLKTDYVDDARNKTMQFLNLDDKATYAEIVKKNPYILISKPEHIDAHLDSFAEFFGKSREEIIEKAIGAPTLMTIVPDIAFKNFQDFQEETGLDNDVCKDLVLKHPRLLTQKRKLLKHYIEENSKILGMSKEEYIELGKINYSLFSMRPIFIERFRNEVSDLLELDYELIEKAYREKPSMITRTLENTQKNISDIKDFLNLNHQSFKTIAEKNPRIVGETFVKVKNTVENICNKLNLDKDTVAEFSYENPQFITWSENLINQNFEEQLKYFGITYDELAEVIKQNPRLITLPIDSLDNYVTKGAQLLDIEDVDEWKNAVRRNPKLATIEPNELNEYVEASAWALGIEKDVFVDMGLDTPQIITLPASMHYETLIDVPKMLGIENKEAFKRAIIKNPVILLLKPDVLVQDIIDTANLLEIDARQYAIAALKNPQLYTLPSLYIDDNITKTSKFMKMSKKELALLGLENPTIFSLKPSIIKETFDNTVQMLNISSDEFIEIAKSNPNVLSLTAEQICTNLDECAKIMGLESRDDYFELAKQNAALFSIMAKMLKEICNENPKKLGMSREQFIALGKKHPDILTTKPEKILRIGLKNILKK